MLQNTFIHIPRIGRSAEEKLWKSGIHSWNCFLDNSCNANLPLSKTNLIKDHINKSMNALDNNDHEFFARSIESKDQWRAYHEFKDKTCFLDIETTGLDKHRNKITVIGLYDGKKSKVFINGQNLNEFSEEIRKYSNIVSFNGRCFDIPFIKANFPLINFNHLHIDLRFFLKNIGFSGGLKHIEPQFGIHRDESIAEVDGYEAVRLWKRYEKGDEEALKTLVEYNIADIENLKTIMDQAYYVGKEHMFDRIIRN